MYKKSKNEPAKYIIRFDDICPTMNWKIWNQIEEILDKYHIKPIIAVVPNNQDRNLKCSEPRQDFWELIRNYQQKGYMVAMHGYNHVYTNHNAGILGISANSEFATVSEEGQQQKFELAFRIFSEQHIKADAFIAPSHSFDWNTIKVLSGMGITVISDGHLNYPYRYKGMLWIPCQIWDRIEPRKAGLYTICIHINKWNEKNIKLFEQDICKYATNIIDPFSVRNAENIRLQEILKNNFISGIFKMKRMVKKIIKRG